MSGGSSALNSAIAAATTNAEPNSSSLNPGRTAAATQTDAAATIHATSRRTGLSRGLPGSQRAFCPYGCAGAATGPVIRATYAFASRAVLIPFG